jgi:hypothetical protein
MTDESKCTEIGCMTPAQVVQCGARFSLLRMGASPQTVSPAEVPSSLTWVQRSMT